MTSHSGTKRTLGPIGDKILFENEHIRPKQSQSASACTTLSLRGAHSATKQSRPANAWASEEGLLRLRSQ